MSNRRRAALGIGLLMGLRVCVAHAEERPAVVVPIADGEAPAERTAPAERQWYGGQVLAADLAAAGTTVGCIELGGGIPCVLPVVLGGALVHAGHGNYGRAALSLAAHVALPSLGLIVGHGATRECTTTMGGFDGGTWTSTSCASGGGGESVGAVIGLVAAAALDAALAYDGPMPSRTQTAARRPPSVLPTMALGHNDAVVGLSGRF